MSKPSVTIVVMENEEATAAKVPFTVRSFRAAVVPAVEGFFADGIDPEDAIRNLKETVRRLFKQDMKLVRIFSMPVEELFDGPSSKAPSV